MNQKLTGSERVQDGRYNEVATKGLLKRPTRSLLCHKIGVVIRDAADSLLSAQVDHGRKVGDALAVVEIDFLEMTTC